MVVFSKVSLYHSFCFQLLLVRAGVADEICYGQVVSSFHRHASTAHSTSFTKFYLWYKLVFSIAREACSHLYWSWVCIPKSVQ